jgi:catechol 2,3-dioxygenase-like lactoylglutathione lyase family enzyme
MDADDRSLDMQPLVRSSRDVIIRAENWAAASQFYTTVLGLPVTHQAEGLLGFETGSFCLYLEQGPAHGAVFEFLGPDVQAAKRRLLAAGCVVLEEDATVPRCYLRDPFGLMFNLGQAAVPEA